MMPNYDEVYNEVVTVNDEMYFVQDGELLDEPMVRSIDNLLKCERDNVQMMLDSQG